MHAVRIPPDLWAKLKAVASEESRSVNWLVIDMLTRSVAALEPDGFGHQVVEVKPRIKVSAGPKISTERAEAIGQAVEDGRRGIKERKSPWEMKYGKK